MTNRLWPLAIFVLVFASSALAAPPPVPGGAGSVAAGDIQTSSITLTFLGATPQTPHARYIRHEVYMHTEDALDSVWELECRGGARIVGPVVKLQGARWFAKVERLTPGTTYWFNVLAIDIDGGRTPYRALKVRTRSLRGAPGPLGRRLTITRVKVAPAAVDQDRPLRACALKAGGLAVAWSQEWQPFAVRGPTARVKAPNQGPNAPDPCASTPPKPAPDGVYVTWLDDRGQRVRPDTLTGTGHLSAGPVEIPGGIALVVNRYDHAGKNRTGTATLIVVDPNGQVVTERTFQGDCDMKTEGCTAPGYGDLVWDGQRLCALLSIGRDFGALGTHQGDGLWYLKPDGTIESTVFGWGWSHSLNQKLAVFGDQLLVLGHTDCQPDRGLGFRLRTGDRLSSPMRFREEPKVTVAESAGAQTCMGGAVPIEGGFLVAFTSEHERGPASDVATVKIAADGTVSPPVWITSTPAIETSPRIARLGDRSLVVWQTRDRPHQHEARTFAALVNDRGAVEEGPEELDAVVGAWNMHDRAITWPNGDAGWVFHRGDRHELEIYRLKR